MSITILILFVEDEPIILETLSIALEDGGYEVEKAENGIEAVKALDERADSFAAIVTDIRMPDGPNGWEVARHARELRHDIPVVYITGDSGSDWAVYGVPESLLLQKPFAPAQLLVAVSTLLTKSSTTLGSSD